MNNRVLVIDDEQVIRDGCVRVLSREGYDVRTANNGNEGLEKLKEEQAHVVLLDLMMPGIDGFETLAEIKEHWPEITVIIITGFATVEKAVQAMKQGAFDFLAKPFNPDYLRIVVKRAIEQKTLKEETVRLREEKEEGLAAIVTEQSRLRTIINCMESGVLVVGNDMTVLLHNPTLIRLLEIQTDPMIGKPLFESVRNPDLHDMVKKVHAEGTTMSVEFEEGTVGKGFIRAHCAPVRGKHDEIIGSVTVFEDLSSFKEVDQLKSDFVAMVSHELRAPLASVEQIVYVLQGGLVGDLTEKGHQMLKRILVRTNELQQLVKNLLDLSRLETGILIQNMEPIDLHELLEGVCEMIRPQAESKEQTLGFECANGQDFTVVGDRDNLLGVFNNLLSNAVKYTPNGGDVNISLVNTGSLLRIAVRDTGVGIPTEDLDRIFDRFYRVKGKSRGITGSGLGLSVAKSIVEAHRGKIEVKSIENEGSTFEVILPIQV